MARARASSDVRSRCVVRPYQNRSVAELAIRVAKWLSGSQQEAGIDESKALMQALRREGRHASVRRDVRARGLFGMERSRKHVRLVNERANAVKGRSGGPRPRRCSAWGISKVRRCIPPPLHCRRGSIPGEAAAPLTSSERPF